MSNKQTKILEFRPDSQYDEVADSLGDGFEIIIDGESALDDGFQYTDLFTLIQAQPKLQEIVNDAPVFYQQFSQLTPETAQTALLEVGNRILAQGKQFGKVSRFLINFLWSAATGYRDSLTVLELGQRQVLEKRQLFAGQDVFPPLLTQQAA
ncbi:MAG: hypothetical protein AAF741_18770 [Bacteroidota bacterium]